METNFDSLANLPIFIMPMFKMLKETTSKLDRLNREFLWLLKRANPMYWFSWIKLMPDCNLKEQGFELLLQVNFSEAFAGKLFFRGFF